jgi:hypothetical protein
VLIVLVGRATPLDDPRNAVAVAVTAASHPHPAAEIASGDLALLPDTQWGLPAIAHRRAINLPQPLVDRDTNSAPWSPQVSLQRAMAARVSGVPTSEADANHSPHRFRRILYGDVVKRQ